MKRKLSIAAAATSALTLAGCQQYLARQDLVEPYSGNAAATNLALQMSDPWPPYVYDTRIPTNGRRQANAVLKYAKKDEEKPPQDIAPVQLVVPQNN
jgi:hypothetical protein